MRTNHRDYPDSVNKPDPEERPQSLIFALDPFNLIYESSYDSNGEMTSLHVPSMHAVLFSSALNHAGGFNPSDSPNQYIYQIFAYVVSNEADYPPKVGSRVNIDLEVSQTITTSEHTRTGRERVQTNSLTYSTLGQPTSM